ncbi:DUF1080 domain-containing protein [candidate division KSB1 bacterium]|nr:DUF1080 domain-containing protein [candidate division KSB1 bacterium]
MRYVLILSLLCVVLAGCTSEEAVQAMGDWKGHYTTEDGQTGDLFAQIIDRGNGNYEAIITVGHDTKVKLMGKTEENKIVFEGKVDVGSERGGAYDVKAAISGSKFTGKFEGAENSGTLELKKDDKTSPSLGAVPPAGAVVLFDGKNLDHWLQRDGEPAKWKILEDGAMEITEHSLATKDEFGDHKLHIEFRTPQMAEKLGQARGNSGVYVFGRYEVQVLDSYGMEPADNLCGGIYSKAAPKVNACAPPGTWQTYDITFYAPQFDESGAKIKNAEITVEHNGILIHDKLVLDGITPGGVANDEVPKGGLMLQDHGDPVQYRNIWALPL